MNLQNVNLRYNIQQSKIQIVSDMHLPSIWEVNKNQNQCNCSPIQLLPLIYNKHSRNECLSAAIFIVHKRGCSFCTSTNIWLHIIGHFRAKLLQETTFILGGFCSLFPQINFPLKSNKWQLYLAEVQGKPYSKFQKCKLSNVQ